MAITFRPRSRKPSRILIIDPSAQVRHNPGVGAVGEWAFIQQLAHAAGQYIIDAIRLQVEGRSITEFGGPDKRLVEPLTDRQLYRRDDRLASDGPRARCGPRYPHP